MDKRTVVLVRNKTSGDVSTFLFQNKNEAHIFESEIKRDGPQYTSTVLLWSEIEPLTRILASTRGEKGGIVKSEKKSVAARENGKKGGRPFRCSCCNKMTQTAQGVYRQYSKGDEDRCKVCLVCSDLIGPSGTIESFLERNGL